MLDASADQLNRAVWPNVAEPLRSGVVVSIHSAGRRFGALLVLRTAEHPLATGDVEVIEELGRRFAVALENARLHAEAQRATRLRDDFLSVAAHELKTPVTSLRGYAQLLVRNANEPDSGLLARGLQTIEMQSDKLRQLTDKLLDISRIDSGKLRLEPRQVDIAELVRGCVETVQDAANLHTLTVRTPATCYGSIDPLRFEQVVANLLSNAIKYSPDGGDIEVRLTRCGDDVVRLRVRDHGLGIPPDRRARLFDRMYQAHGDGYLSGLGLGLFISRQIVEFHGGTIAAEFPSDGGTEMTVTLPPKTQ
jgi:signal transduction histidine kinase